jgi:Type IV secretory pathway, VirB10 components
MGKDYLDSNIDNFNTTRRLNNKPKLIIVLVVSVLFILIFYVILSAKKETAANYDGIETIENRLDNDEYIKNMANNKGYWTKVKEDNSIIQLENLSEEDYKEIFTNESTNTVVEGNIQQDLLKIAEDSMKEVYPPLPVSNIDNGSAIQVIDRNNIENDETRQIQNLTAEQIATYNANRFTELQTALKSPTKVYTSIAENNIKPVKKDLENLTYEEQLDMILDKTGISNNKTVTEEKSDGFLTGDYELQHRVQKARKGEIKTGFVIPAILMTELNSSVAGTVIGQVRQNVYDTATGKDLLIPQGSKLLGEYASDVPYGNNRLFISWKRIVFPNGDSLDLDIMPGADMARRAGFSDKVNTHFWKIFGNALLFSFIIAGTNITTSEELFNVLLPVYARDITGSMGEGLAVSLGETMSEMIKKNLNIAPEITIRAGYLFNVMVTKDIVLPPYKQN